MGLLTDTVLQELLVTEADRPGPRNIHIKNYSVSCLTPIGYDLRVGKRYSSTVRGGPTVIASNGSFEILPGETVLVETLENIWMPENRTLSALILSKVSIVSRGISHVSTTVDSDWRGVLLIAITNLSRERVELKADQPFCTIVFLQNVLPSTKLSGHDPGRMEILLDRIAEVAAKKQQAELGRRGTIRRLALFAVCIPLLFISVFGILGYRSYGISSTGFAAMIALGTSIGATVTQFALLWHKVNLE